MDFVIKACYCFAPYEKNYPYYNIIQAKYRITRAKPLDSINVAIVQFMFAAVLPNTK